MPTCQILALGEGALEGEKRKAMADQIATVSKQRLGAKIGRLSSEHMTAVERVIRVQLAL